MICLRREAWLMSVQKSVTNSLQPCQNDFVVAGNLTEAGSGVWKAVNNRR